MYECIYPPPVNSPVLELPVEYNKDFIFDLRLHSPLPPTIHDRRLDHTKMMAEKVVWGLCQGSRRLERYVEEFLKLANQLNWHNAALGVCFQLGLDNETIRCDLPVCEYPLIELINLVRYLNGSNFEVEKIKEDSKSRRPAPSGTCRVMPVHASRRTPTYRTNGSDCLSSPKHPKHSCPLTSHVASHIYIEDIMDLALPMGSDAPILSPSPLSPLVPSSPPERCPEPAPPECPPEPAPPECPPVPEPPEPTPSKRPPERPPVPAPPEPTPSKRPPERPPVPALLEPTPPERPSVPAPPERPPEPAPPERPPVPALPEHPPEHPSKPVPPELSRACRTLISTKKILAGGGIFPDWLPRLGSPSSLIHHGQIVCSAMASLLRHGLPNCVLRHGFPSFLIRHGSLSSLIRHGSPGSLINHGFPNCLLRHGLLNCVLRHGFPDCLLRHGFPNYLLRHGSPSSLLRHGLLDCVLRHGFPGCPLCHGSPSSLTCHGSLSSLIRPGGLPSLHPVSALRPPPSPVDMLRRKTYLPGGGSNVTPL
ncbi:Titin [Labeo rohita]|uniref:Titin n=1 Tax=Labeo rohita TaxID=84645 RepID=A0ABQ8LC89_LABRO|nr:Titin [Labeo rohita]